MITVPAFVLVLIMEGRAYNTVATTTVGPFYTAQTCIEARDTAIKRGYIIDAFCLKVDRDVPAKTK